MSSKKTQKINNLGKPNGSQTSTPNGVNHDDNDHMNSGAQQHNPQQMNPQLNNGIPPNNMGMMGNPMNTGMNFAGMNNPNFRGMPNTNLHPQQLAALQAQAHFANMQQNNPNATNNPQYQQYLQQLQQNQMFMQMQNQQQQAQGQNPQQAAGTQQFQGQVPQQQMPPHYGGQQQQQVHPFQQSQQPARQPQQPTPQQTHPTQQPTPQQAPQQAPTPQQVPPPQPQQQQQQPQSSKPDPKSRVGSIVAGQIPQQQQQRPMTTGNTMMSRGPQSSGPQSAGHGGQQQQLPQGPLGNQGVSGQQQQQPQQQPGMIGPNTGPNAATMNVMNFRKQMSNLATLKFLDFCELIGVRSDSTKNILYWRKIITDYFSEIGVLRYSVKSGVDSRQFEFSVPIIPRFFFSIIQSGVTRMEIQPGLLRTQVLANGTTYLESSRCCFTHYYSDGSYVNIHGNIRGILNQNLKLDWLDFQTHVFIPGVEWPSLEKLLSDESKVQELFYNQEKSFEKQSTDVKRLQLLTKLRSNYKVFHSMSNFGLQESVMRVMQVSDVMAHLKSLMLFSISSDTTGPLNALDSFVSQSILANKNKNEGGEKIPTPRPGAKDEKTSPLDNMSSNSPMTRGKVPPLDMSQSTLTKRRRKSNLDNGLSPKSTADSPKQVTKSNKKTKR